MCGGELPERRQTGSQSEGLGGRSCSDSRSELTSLWVPRGESSLAGNGVGL